MSNLSPHQCTCLASFSSRDALDSHLKEHRVQEQHLQSLESYAKAQLEICRAHRMADDEANDKTDAHSNTRDGTNLPLYYCPRADCKRNSNQLNTRQALEVHFEQHVSCDEVCVVPGCRHREFRVVRLFIRHVQAHQIDNPIKKAYITDTCNDLRRNARDQLVLEERSRRAATAVINRKRPAEDETNLQESAQKKLNEVDAGIVGQPSVQFFNSEAAQVSPPAYHEQPVAAVFPTHNAADTIAPGIFADSLDGMYVSTTGISQIQAYDAEVNRLINFPEAWRTGTFEI